MDAQIAEPGAEGAAARYPRQSLGRAFERALGRWGIPQARLGGYLGAGSARLAALALCPSPDPDDGADDFEARIDALAAAFGVDRSRLAFVCRSARGEGIDK